MLASIIIPSLSDAQARSRDARRLSDIRTIQTALEVYNLNNGVYPSSTAGSLGGSWTALGNNLGVTLPTDPLNSTDTSTTWAAPGTVGDNYTYSYQSANISNSRERMVMVRMMG